MSNEKISRNAPCPCGSGKKYKKCCWGKSFDYIENDAGTISKSTSMTDELSQLLKEQKQEFIAQFGRQPGPEDEVFFDMPHGEHTEHLTVEAMKEVGMDPAVIYAYEKTGRLVTERNEHLLSEADLDEWDAAIDEYQAQQAKTPHFPVGTVNFYGPDNKTTTKIVASVILHEGAEPIIQRWLAKDVTTDAKIQRQLGEFFAKYGVTSVSMSDGNVGCPHEAGQDFPHGEKCPLCPFWHGLQGSRAK